MRTPRPRSTTVAALLFLVASLSCGREVTGPGGRGRVGQVQLAPAFETVRLAGDGRVMSIGDVVDFARVRVLLVRSNGDTAVDRVVDFPPGADSVSLSFNVTLSQAATSEGEPMAATLKYIDAAGDTVFSGGPVQVLAKSSGASSTPTPPIPVRYVGRGANAAALAISPPSHTGTINTTVAFSAIVTDSQGGTLDTVPVAFTSTDSALVRVNLRTGLAELVGARGPALIIAQTLTGQSDTALVSITPTASAILVQNGAGQSVRQGSPFPQPVRVRVNAVDGLPVAGVPVSFAVTRGQGSVSAAFDTTDANGLAETQWTAGDSAGVGQLTATVVGRALSVNVTGTQLSSGPTALTFETQPTGIAAGDPLPTLRLVVRDAIGDTVRAYNGPIDLSLTGGAVGATLIGTTQPIAASGLVLVEGLSVSSAGTNYRIQAAVPSGPTAQSNAFNVTASLPAAIQVVSGTGQTVPASTPLPDSIVVRVVDVLNAPKAGVTVTWTVTAGGGTTSPTSAVTDANGRAATRWTVGAGGAQELRATVGQLAPAIITAAVAAADGPPILFIASENANVPLGRSRSVAFFLTNPTPSPLTVQLTESGAGIAWSVDSLVIPAGGTTATASLAGVATGVAWAIATSAAGNDSILVAVDSLGLAISAPAVQQVVSGDTIRTVVRLNEPAPAGGVTVTVVSSDSTRILVAPGTGLGAQDDPCYGCGGLEPMPGAGASLLAPPAGTATLVIPEGQVARHLVILPIAPALTEAGTDLVAQAPGHAAASINVRVRSAQLSTSCQNCELGIGQIGYVNTWLPERLRRDLPVRIRALTPGVAQIRDSVFTIPRGASYLYGMRLVGTDTGTFVYTVEADGFAPDTAEAYVRPGNLEPSYRGVSVDAGSEATVYVYAGIDLRAGPFGLGEDFIDPVNITATSRDTAIAAIVRPTIATSPLESGAEFAVRGGAVGSTWVVFTAPGYSSDSVEVTVFSSPLSIGGGSQLGVGVRTALYAYVGYTRATPQTLTVTSSDPAVARVLSPSIVMPVDDASANFFVEGVSAGTATITVSRGAGDSTTHPVTVGTPAFDLTPPEFGNPFPADSVERFVNAYIATAGTYVAPTEPFTAVMRSTDPSVLLVSDSLVEFSPSSYASIYASVRGIAPGTAQLVISAPGFTPDTTPLITVQPRRLEFVGYVGQIGTGSAIDVNLVRLASFSAAQPVTLTVTGPAGTTVAEPSDTIPADQQGTLVRILAGNTAGTVTLVASAPGFTSDTLVFGVGRSGVDIYADANIGAGEPFAVTSYLYGPVGQYRSPGRRFRFTLASRDTTVARVVTDSIVFDSTSYVAASTASVVGVGPGSTWLVATNPDGVADADSVLVQIVAPRLYQYQSYLTMPMQSQTYLGQLYVVRDWARPAPVWVRLQSSDPALVSVPDSVLIAAGSAYGDYVLTTGDTVGSAIVTATAPGYASASFNVLVTRAEVRMQPWFDLTTSNRVPVEVYATNTFGYGYEPSVPVPLEFTILDTSRAVVERDTLTLQPGLVDGQFTYVQGRAVGRTTLVARDARTTDFARVTTTSQDLEVRQAILQVYDYPYNTRVPVGGRLVDPVYFYSWEDNDSTWVRIRALGGRARVPQDSVLMLELDYEGYFDLEGVSAGIDTIVIEAAGYLPDTVIVTVGDGLLALTGADGFSLPPARLVQGDSVEVAVELLSSVGEQVVAAAPITVNITAPAGAQVRVGGASVTSVQIPPGQRSARFWIVGTAPATGTLQLSASGFISATAVITTRIP